MRRHLARIGKLAVLLLLFAGWACFFWWFLGNPPQYVVHTGAKEESIRVVPFRRIWVEFVSEHGPRVTLAIERPSYGKFAGIDRLETWDMRTGKEVTPSLWNDPDLKTLLNDGVFSASLGEHFAENEAVWQGFCQRLECERADALRQGRREERWDERFPHRACFSPDGRLYAYMSRNGLPTYNSDGDGVAIDLVATGQRITVLQGATSRIFIAPDGRTALSEEMIRKDGFWEMQLVLWDLESSSRRSIPLGLGNVTLGRVEFSEDSRFVFVELDSLHEPRSRLRWWDTATAEQRGEVIEPGRKFVAGQGLTVVTHDNPNGLECFSFCDAATGRSLGNWTPGVTTYSGCSTGGRYLAAELYKEHDKPKSSSNPFFDWVHNLFAAKFPTKPRGEIVLLDLIDRRDVAHLPGHSAKLSPDGRWLATIDEEGVIRVWELPLRTPWAAILGYAAIATIGCWGAIWGVVVLVRRFRSRTAKTGQAASAA